jgi:hypothetical protein
VPRSGELLADLLAETLGAGDAVGVEVARVPVGPIPMIHCGHLDQNIASAAGR